MTRRTVLNQRDTLDAYADFLRGNTKELDALLADALISVTSFFRNADAFEGLKQKVFAKLLHAGGDAPVRIWVLGCSTGQEAYSMAIAYAEATEKTSRARKLQVFATDLSEHNLQKARHGLYPKSLTQDVSPQRLRRFFTEEDGGYRVIKSLRESVVFARHNLISDPPFSRMDLISCRNVMIYLEPSLQKKLLPAFHYALNPEGFLFLGGSESIGSFTELFAPVGKKEKIYGKKAAPAQIFRLPLKNDTAVRHPLGPVVPASPAAVRSPPDTDPFRGELSAEREADRVTVNQFAPPGVLINDQQQILQFRGSTDAYLEAPTGKPSFDLLKMAREGLMLPLRTALNLARKDNKTVRLENVPVRHNGTTRAVTVEIVPLKNLKERRFLVLFGNAGPGPSATGGNAVLASPGGVAPPPRPVTKKEESRRIASLERDLAETRDYLQSIQEYQEAANEELQASNEEGQSANEELQSLNEELETSKEELESTNEELTTANEEMVTRNAELNRLYGDLTNLQTAANQVIVLLGRDLTIRRFSVQAEKQFSLLASDVGRPISNVRHNLPLPDLDSIIVGVIATSHECEREVRATDGRWYSLRVRPYLTLDKKVDGAVLVLVDIDDLKRTERIITEAHEHAAAIIRTVPDPLVILSSDLRVLTANEAFYRSFKLTRAKTKGRSIFELAEGAWNIPRLRRLLEEIVPQQSFFSDYEVTHDFPKIGSRSLLFNARVLNEPGSKAREILLGIHDITVRKRAEDALAQAQVKLAAHAGELESIVARRTAQLTAANRRLEGSIATVRQGQEQYRRVLVESQIMQIKLRHLTRQILTAQEEERKHISRELHDEVVQTLVGINVELSALGKGASARPWREKIARTQRLVENAVHSVHGFARDLRPAVLDDLGLIPALHAYSQGLAARKKFKIKMTAFSGVESLGGAERTVLFRVAQEALTNVARHANATLVKLNISKAAGTIRMEISDNGRSFAVTKTLLARNTKRLGLVGMRERIEMVGGKLAIQSSPGKGTTVRAELPFLAVKNKL